jgi:hypothetical protein
MQITDTQTATPVQVLTLIHGLSSGSAAGFGVDFYAQGQTTAGTNRTMSLMRSTWVNPADVSRTGRILFYAYDSVGARECLRLEASGTAPMVGFNGVAAVARQSLVALSMSVGTGDNAVVDVGTAFSQATLNNNFRDLVDKVNAIRAILVNVGIAV